MRATALYARLFSMSPVLIACLAFVSTMVGGMVALRLKDKLHLILGFSAGAVIAVAFFDLLPEALELGASYYSASFITSLVALGFLVYLVLDRSIFLHAHSDEPEDGHAHNEARPARGTFGAASLSIHSFLDGVAIGLAFQVSVAVGGIVALAVLAHDFSDGINTVNLVLKNGGVHSFARKFLLIDAIAPVLGAASTLFFTLPESSLAIILALFAGFFLYIGASDLVPESHHAHPKFLTTFMTVLGMAVLYGVIHFATL